MVKWIAAVIVLAAVPGRCGGTLGDFDRGALPIKEVVELAGAAPQIAAIAPESTSQVEQPAPLDKKEIFKLVQETFEGRIRTDRRQFVCHVGQAVACVDPSGQAVTAPESVVEEARAASEALDSDFPVTPEWKLAYKEGGNDGYKTDNGAQQFVCREKYDEECHWVEETKTVRKKGGIGVGGSKKGATGEADAEYEVITTSKKVCTKILIGHDCKCVRNCY